MGFALGKKPEHETLCFLCKVAAGGDEGQLVSEAVAGTLVLVFFWFSLFLPWCSALCVSLCVRSSMRLWNPWLQIALEWPHDCCIGLALGRQPQHKTLCFSRKVAAGGGEGQLVCEAVAGTLVLVFFGSLYFSLGVLHFACLCVCVVLCGCGIPGCRSHWNGRMNVAMFCCHVRR